MKVVKPKKNRENKGESLFYSTQLMDTREWCYSLLEAAPKVMQLIIEYNSTEYKEAAEALQDIRETREALRYYELMPLTEATDVQVVLNMMLKLLCDCQTLDSIVRRTCLQVSRGSQRGVKDIKRILGFILDLEQRCTSRNIPQIVNKINNDLIRKVA